ncbi:hypothetical protein, partial [Sodaliphilus sp.]|uniref:hypothetical protein n=1 Tax=Sodaliphilus sp. TaxID=2815818 RepID=UPI00389017C0
TKDSANHANEKQNIFICSNGLSGFEVAVFNRDFVTLHHPPHRQPAGLRPAVNQSYDLPEV